MTPQLGKTVATGAFLVFMAIGAGAARAQAPQPFPQASDHTAQLVTAFERQVEADREALKIPGLSIAVVKAPTASST